MKVMKAMQPLLVDKTLCRNYQFHLNKGMPIFENEDDFRYLCQNYFFRIPILMTTK